MKLFKLLTMTTVICFFMSQAHAIPITWTLDGVTFEDNGTATGSFDFDADTGIYSNISITTVGGGARIVGSAGAGSGPVWPGATYEYSAGFSSSPSRVFGANELDNLDALPGTISGFSGRLIMMFASDLTNNGGTINIINDVLVNIGGSFSTAFSGESTCNAFPNSTGCFSFAPFRDIVSGSVTSISNQTCEFGGTYPNCNPRPATVPEPGTLGLLGIGLAGMGFARRRTAT